MCELFTSLANKIADDDEESREVMEWIERKNQIVKTTRSISGSNNMSLQAFHTALDDGASQHTISLGSRQDPKCSKRKGAPRKLRKKSPLESNSSKAKSRPNSDKGRRPEVGPSKLGKVHLLVQTCDQGSYYMQAPIIFSELLMVLMITYLHNKKCPPNFILVAPPSDLLYSQDPQKSHSNRTVIVKSMESTSGSTSTGILSMVFTVMHFIVSLGIILAMDKYLKKAFVAAAIKFPSTLFGIFYVFTTLNVLDFVVPAAASGLMNFFEPTFLFIQRWLPLLYVPSLVVLPLASIWNTFAEATAPFVRLGKGQPRPGGGFHDRWRDFVCDFGVHSVWYNKHSEAIIWKRSVDVILEHLCRTMFCIYVLMT